VLENMQGPSVAANKADAGPTDGQHALEGQHGLDPASEVDARSCSPIEQLLRSNRAFESRVRELEAANDGLRREVARETRKMRKIMKELALAAERAGDRPLARAIRAVSAGPEDLSFVAACGLNGERACALHGERDCARCRALGPVQRLSVRERQILRLLTEGSRSPCIAAHLGISIATVEVHRRNIMRKLDLHTVAALTKYAVREGLTAL
jgi:DNA-binding CsgD family transcriptional regulator